MRHLGYSVFVAIVLFSSCGESGAQSEGYVQITSLEDSIKVLSSNLAEGEELPQELSDELINRLSDFYHANPEDAHAPECLDKLHMIYSSTGRYQMAARYADTLIEKYPAYTNRPLVLESQANAYDFYITPRDTSKVRHYYQLLLDENPDLLQDKRADIEERLDNLHLTIEQLILQNQE